MTDPQLIENPTDVEVIDKVKSKYGNELN